MSITTRVMLAVAIAAIVATAALLVGMHTIEREATEARLIDMVTNVMETGGRERCEANPRRFAEHSRMPRRMARRGRMLGGNTGVDVYFADGSSSLGATSLSREVLAQLGEREVLAVGRRLLVRMSWEEGPCAIVSVRRPPDGMLGDSPRGEQANRRIRGANSWRPWLLALVVLGVSLAASVLALRSPLRRLSMLSQAATELATSGFQTRTKLDEASRLGAPDEVGQLTLRLREAVDRIAQDSAALAARDVALTEYVTHTTHDLMTPVTALMQHLAQLEEEAREGQAASPEAVSHAMRETHYLTQLVGNLGIIARVDASDRIVQKRDLDLREIVERVAARHMPLARSHRLSLAHSVPDVAVIANVDELLVERALGNLVYNAIRHHRLAEGQVEGHVALVLSAQGARFALRVLDDGANGAKEAARIQALLDGANPDSQARTRTHGFGMEVVRKVALAHDFAWKATPSEEGGLEIVMEGARAS